jgi:predicted nucleic-acid-binding Zn-ribbon protein
MITKCLACGKDDLIATDVESSGGCGPSLLPGTGIFVPALFTIVVCSDCGFVHFYVRSKDMEKVKKSRSFQSIKGVQYKYQGDEED